MINSENDWKKSYEHLQNTKDAQRECVVCGCPITQKEYKDYKMCPWCYQQSIME